MAGVTISILIKQLADKFSSLIRPQASSCSSSSWSSSSTEPPTSADDEELLKLGRTMARIHATLEDAEERDISDKSERLRLAELKEVAYDAEDVLDEYDYEVLRLKVEARRRAREDGQVDMNSYCPKITISDEFAHKVVGIRERFEEITGEWDRIGLREADGKRRRTNKWKPDETTSLPDEPKTLGREDEKRSLMEWLQESADDKVSVLTIVGMGGLGKTTVARMVYNDPLVRQQFQLRGWVCVSENFDDANLMRKIISAFSSKRLDSHSSLDELCQELIQVLEGNSFFLVLDDVWNEKFELWDPLRTLLNIVGNGKIIVTTRSEHVARIIQTTTSSSIHLSTLSHDNCRSLFMQIASGGRDPNSDAIDKIIKKCGGLPLAIKVLASVLRFEDEQEWIDIVETELSEIDEDKYNILPVLKLSYDRMPAELRPCFKYLSLFPKDSPLVKSRIIKQWMAQGFLKPKGRKKEEDIGKNYFDQLSSRSLVSQHEEGENEGLVYAMHDLIHDLAHSVARDEYLLIRDVRKDAIPKTIRHVSMFLESSSEATYLKILSDAKHLLSCDGVSEDAIPETIRHLPMLLESASETTDLKILSEAKQLRTLIVHSDDYGEDEGLPIGDLLNKLTCLRTLVWRKSRGDIGDLRNSLGGLKHLRYLEMDLPCGCVPESMYSLYHLQTLQDAASTCSDMVFHGGIEDLINLRHLEGHPKVLPREVGRLTNLQTIDHFKVGAESWECKISDLKDLANLRGALKVEELRSVGWSDVTPPAYYLKSKQAIEDLQLEWSDAFHGEDDQELAERVLDCLRPNSSIKNLAIRTYPGATFPAWLGDASFSKLQELVIHRCEFVSLPALGQLPALKTLKIAYNNGTECVGLWQPCSNDPPTAAPSSSSSSTDQERSRRRSCFFPSLEQMHFDCMYKWEEWNGVEEVGDFPRLLQLGIHRCGELKRIPAFTRLQQLLIYYCPQLRGIPELTCLRRLKIADCPQLRGLPFLPSLRELELTLMCVQDLASKLPNRTPKRHRFDIRYKRHGPLAFPNPQSLPSLQVLRFDECWDPSWELENKCICADLGVTRSDV